MKDTEYFLAVTPIKELFHNKPIRLTNKKINKVGNLDSDINKKIGDFISTGKKEIKPAYNINLEDFDSIREYIENEITPDTLAEQSKDIDDPSLRGVFEVVFDPRENMDTIIDFINQQIDKE